MSRGLTVAELAALQAENATVKILVYVTNSTFTWRFCTGTHPFGYGGNTYENRGMKFGYVGVGDIAIVSMNVEIDNYDDSLGAEVARRGGLNGSVATITLLTKSDGVFGDAVTMIDGGVVSAQVSGSVKIDVSANFGRSRRPGLGVASRSCLHVKNFDGPLCQYTAYTGGPDTSCEGTWADCSTKLNTVHFTGFRYALNPGESIKIEYGSITMGDQQGGGGGRRAARRGEGWIGISPQGMMQRLPAYTGGEYGSPIGSDETTNDGQTGSSG